MSRLVPDPVTEPTITLARAAEILSIGLSTAYEAAHRGDLPTVRVGRTFRVPTAVFLEQFRLVPTGQPDPDPIAA